jgi:hypothetical protein
MPSTPREVFDLFTREGSDGPPVEVGLLAYGAFAAELYEWVEHEERRLGRAVSEEEINAWVACRGNARDQGLNPDWVSG